MKMLDSLLNAIFEQLLAPFWIIFDFIFRHLSLSTLSVLLGLGLCLPQAFGLKEPRRFATFTRRFSRSFWAGVILMALATLWFLYNVRAESLADYAGYKQYLMLMFLAVGIGACLYLRDFLAVRGLAILLLLVAKLTLDVARWHDSAWRLVLAVWAYLSVLAGMWLTVSPWRLRDFVEWSTATDRRVRVGCSFCFLFGLFIAALGLTSLRVQATGLP